MFSTIFDFQKHLSTRKIWTKFQGVPAFEGFSIISILFWLSCMTLVGFSTKLVYTFSTNFCQLSVLIMNQPLAKICRKCVDQFRAIEPWKLRKHRFLKGFGAKIEDPRSEKSKNRYFERSNYQFPLLEKRLFCEFRDRLGCFLKRTSFGSKVSSGFWDIFGRKYRFFRKKLIFEAFWLVLAIVHLRFEKKSRMDTLIGDARAVFGLVSSLLVIFIKEIKSFIGRVFSYFRSKIPIFRKMLIFEVFWLVFAWFGSRASMNWEKVPCIHSYRTCANSF